MTMHYEGPKLKADLKTVKKIDATNINKRLEAIDWLRGLVIVIMTLDHVRDYVHGSLQDPLSDTNIELSLFITRWVTHLCAPTFVFLTGVSAGLIASRKSSSELSVFLFTRGLWLIFLEMTIISFAWKFSWSNEPGIVLGVIWAIGISMVVLSVLVKLPKAVLLFIGIAIILFGNLLDNVVPVPLLSEPAPVWMMINRQILFTITELTIIVLYPVIAWVGIIILGYCSASLFLKEKRHRAKTFFSIGLLFIGLFIFLRYLNIYGDPSAWVSSQNFTMSLLSFLNVEKYPPSLLFTLVTLGLSSILVGAFEKIELPFKTELIHFGSVPLFFYVAHLYLIHLIALLLGYYQGFSLNELLISVLNKPEGFGFELWVVYLVWGVVILLLYPMCRWYSKVKKNRKEWWFSYL